MVSAELLQLLVYRKSETVCPWSKTSLIQRQFCFLVASKVSRHTIKQKCCLLQAFDTLSTFLPGPQWQKRSFCQIRSSRYTRKLRQPVILPRCSCLTELVCLLCLNISKWKINGNKHQGLTRLKSHARTWSWTSTGCIWVGEVQTSVQVCKSGPQGFSRGTWQSFTGKLWSVGCTEAELTQLRVYSDFERGFCLRSCISLVDVVLDAAQVPCLFCLMAWSRHLSLLHPMIIPLQVTFSLPSAWARLG